MKYVWKGIAPDESEKMHAVCLCVLESSSKDYAGLMAFIVAKF